MNTHFISLFYFIHLLLSIEANDILGCGGFIKSHVPIDFSKVEVKLVTKQGIVKDRTNCAPNNGYYFLPLYDKGELKLELSPPPGWSFTPKEITLNIDGTDPCSQGRDINFIFEGFGIAGYVESLGESFKGPQHVTVTLLSKDGKKTTETKQDGSFSFSPVFPGVYTVSISHPSWKIYRDSVEVEVKEGNTELPKNSLIIQGYDVTGKFLTADGKPIQNTIIALFRQKKDKQLLIEGCEKQENIRIEPNNLYLCYVFTNADGEFKFPVVPFGSYFVKPYFKEDHIYYQPNIIEFSVGHTSEQLNEHFQVIGVTIPGRITNGKNEPISNVKIFLDGQEVTRSDELGRYKLTKLKVGTYQLKAKADDVMFDEVLVNVDEKAVSIKANLATLPVLSPSAYRVCGKIISDEPQIITFSQIGSAKLFETETNQNQEFCQYLPPGKYDVSVKMSNANERNGLQFFPVTQKIEVLSAEDMNLVFSQLKSSVVGKIKCIQKKDCEGLSVTLKYGADELEIPVENSEYSAHDVSPGLYEIHLSNNEFCWKSEKQSININTVKVEIPTFIQTGYKLQFVSSHEAVVTYNSLIDKKPVELEIRKGVTWACLDSPGEYEFHLNSCHEFESNSIRYNTAAEKKQIIINARKHTVTFSIQSNIRHETIDVKIKIGDEEFTQTVNYANGEYEIQLMLKPFETATVTPLSDSLCFSPHSELKIEGTSDCVHLGTKFFAVPGKVFQGQIQPPLAGVEVQVEDLSNNKVYSQVTDSKGMYKFAPLNVNFDYKISAVKNSYVFTGPDEKGVFFAQKLAEISVEVLDQMKNPLVGVLLSVSGEQSFRRNLQTLANGGVTFHSLSAGDYFLRPMMKEYQFEPAFKMITVKEGQTIKILLTGKRVAFSAFGKLQTVNEDPVEDVNVIASGLGNCTGLSEEAITDSSGAFRIRGLQPYCSFKVYVEGGNNNTKLVERTSPESVELENVMADIENLQITVFRPVLITDVIIKVFTENTEYYRYLKLTLYRETNEPSVIYSTSIDNLDSKVTKNRNYGILIHLPSLQLDNVHYSIHLEPSPNIKGKSQVEYFSANTSFRYIEMQFDPKTSTKEQPIKQSSIWTMISFLMIILLAFNSQTVLQLLKERLNFNIDNLNTYIPITGNSKSISDYDNEIDQIVQDINNVRKHRQKKTT